jgi:hypothetical protein
MHPMNLMSLILPSAFCTFRVGRQNTGESGFCSRDARTRNARRLSIIVRNGCFVFFHYRGWKDRARANKHSVLHFQPWANCAEIYTLESAKRGIATLCLKRKRELV